MKLIYTVSFFLFANIICIIASDSNNSEFQQTLGTDGIYTEYILSIPPHYSNSSNYGKLKLFVVCNRDRDLIIENKKMGLKKTVKCKKLQLNSIEISAEYALPYSLSSPDKVPAEEILTEYGLHIVCNAEVYLTAYLEYDNKLIGLTPVPTSSADKKYLCISKSIESDKSEYSDNITISAIYDKTKLNFFVGGTNETQTIGGLSFGESKSFTMNANDVLSFSASSSQAGLSGSYISAGKPIFVFTGANSENNYYASADPGKHATGNYFPVPPSASEGTLRVSSNKANNTIFVNGSPEATIESVSGSADNCIADIQISDSDMQGIVLSSEHLSKVKLFSEQAQGSIVNFSQYIMPLDYYIGTSIIIVPGDPQTLYSKNKIDLIYKSDKNGAIPEELVIGHIVDNSIVWTKLSDISPENGKVFGTMINDQYYAAKTIDADESGIYFFKSCSAIATYLFSGNGSYTSCLAGSAANIFNISFTDTVAPICDYTFENGEVLDGRITDMPEDSNYRSNLALVYLDSELSDNVELTVEDFIPGEARATTWQLKVIDKKVDAHALIVYSDRRGNSSSVSIDYKGSGVSVDESIIENIISVSPNPAGDKIALKFGSVDYTIAEIKIYDLQGNVLKYFPDIKLSDSFEIDISDLPSASYIIRLKIADNVISHNFRVVR